MLELHALRRLHVGPLDLQVPAGHCVAVTGASGAGKSVLLRMVADLDPHEGEVTLDGVRATDVPAPEWRRRATYVAAESGWWAPLVRDHFAPDAALAERLPAAGIAPEAADWPVTRLSTGERQRLALLRAIRPATRALLLDEPTSGLDADNVERVEALLHAELARGTAILLVTHDPRQAQRLAHRRLVLRDGRLAETPA